jgi:glycine cleavage system H protein
VSQLFAPLDGEVVAVNERLNDAPESVNADPYGAGWMLRVRPSNPDAAVADLLDAQAYARHVAENG